MSTKSIIRFTEIEDAIQKIASDNKISDVESVNIKLSKNGAQLLFKTASNPEGISVKLPESAWEKNHPKEYQRYEISDQMFAELGKLYDFLYAHYREIKIPIPEEITNSVTRLKNLAWVAAERVGTSMVYSGPYEEELYFHSPDFHNNTDDYIPKG